MSLWIDDAAQPLGDAIKTIAKSNKAVYLFASDADKVYHVNSLPKGEASSGFNAKTWLATVSAIVGGKVRALAHL